MKSDCELGDSEPVRNKEDDEESDDADVESVRVGNFSMAFEKERRHDLNQRSYREKKKRYSKGGQSCQHDCQILNATV